MLKTLFHPLLTRPTFTDGGSTTDPTQEFDDLPQLSCKATPRNEPIMGKIEAETCSVCKENLSKYRCPGCAAPYCSLACNKAHKAGSSGGDNPTPPCTGKRAGALLPVQNESNGQRPAGSKRRREDGVRNPDDSIVEEDRTARTATTACIRKGRDQWRGGREDREEEEWQMSADQMERISGCAWLKAALRDPKLQGLLVSDLLSPLFWSGGGEG